MAEPRGVLDFFSAEETPVVPLILARVDTACVDIEQFISEYCQYFEGEMLFLPFTELDPTGLHQVTGQE